MTAYRWTSEPRFTEYIGNAATLTSLFLGVVAIFYSFISNNNLSNSLGTIANVAESLERAEVEIKGVLAESKMLAGKQDQNMQKMQQISENVQSSVAVVASTLDDISSKTTELQSTIYTVPTRLDAISEILERKSQVTAPKPTTRQGFLPGEAAYFNSKASVSGNLITYACALANKHDADFSPVKLSALIGRSHSAEFSSGFFDCMAAAGIIRIKEIKENKGFYKVLEVDAEVAKSIKPEFLKFLDLAYKNNPDKKAEFMEILRTMENSFAASPTTS